MRSYGAIHEREYAGAESNTRGGDMVCDGVSFNGMIENGEVWVRCDDPEFTAEQIMEHECTHDAIAKGEIDPDEVWRKLEKKYGREQMDAWVEDYRQALTGEGLSDLEIEEEIICDAMAGMNKFSGKLDTLAGEYGEVLQSAKQEAERSRENQRGPPEDAKKPAEVGGVKMSISPDFKKDIDAWDGKRAKTFTLGNTSKPLQSIGVKERVIKWASDSILHSLKHDGMSIEVVKRVPEILENPIIIMQSRTVPDRITLMGELKDENSVPVIAVLEVNPKNDAGKILDMNLLNNAYGKNHGIENFLKNSKYLYIDPQKNRTDMWLHSLGLQLPSGTTSYGSIGIISYADGEVNIHAVPWENIFGKEKREIKESEAGRKLSAVARDSDVRQLTAQQEEYFKDFKVRDEDGRLLVMYKGGISTTEGQKRQVCVCIPALSYLLAIGEATPPERVSQLRCI